MPTSPPAACPTCTKALPCKCEKPDASQPPVAALQWTKKISAIDKALDNAPWRRFVKTLLALNGVCVSINEHGIRCNRPATLGHHVVSRHADPSRLCDPRNVVPLCHDCHKTTDGEPADSKRSFAPVRWLFGQVIEHPKPIKRGEVRIVNGRAVIG